MIYHGVFPTQRSSWLLVVVVLAIIVGQKRGGFVVAEAPTPSPIGIRSPSSRPTPAPFPTTSSRPTPAPVSSSTTPGTPSSNIPSKSSSPIFDDWVRIGKEITSPDDFANFGSAVAISDDGKTLALAPHVNPKTSDPGCVYVFAWDGNVWTPKSTFPLTDHRDRDEARHYVALSVNGGDTYYYDNNGNEFQRKERMLLQVWDFETKKKGFIQVGWNFPKSSVMSNHLQRLAWCVFIETQRTEGSFSELEDLPYEASNGVLVGRW